MLLSLLTSEALALSCIFGVYDLNVDDGSVVPPGAVFVASHTYSEPDAEVIGLHLLDAQGQEVPSDVEWSPFVVRLVPQAELAPGQYRITANDGGYYLAGERGFTVMATEPIDAPPMEAPSGLSLEWEREEDPDWGLTNGIDVRFDGVAAASHYEMEVASNQDFTDAAMAVTTGEWAFLGLTLCGSTVDGWDQSGQSYVRVRAVAIDGEVSAWSPFEVTDNSPPGAKPLINAWGCSVAGGTPLSGAALLALSLGLMALRRRDA
ncbi:MAG: hypothetical protein AAGA48_00315 [Myxococcota bacterium]